MPSSRAGPGHNSISSLALSSIDTAKVSKTPETPRIGRVDRLLRKASSSSRSASCFATIASRLCSTSSGGDFGLRHGAEVVVVALGSEFDRISLLFD